MMTSRTNLGAFTVDVVSDGNGKYGATLSHNGSYKCSVRNATLDELGMTLSEEVAKAEQDKERCTKIIQTDNKETVPEIKGITFLTIEEYEDYMNHIPKIEKDWWLRSPGFIGYNTAYVDRDGDVNYNGFIVYISTDVRPVLIINRSSSNLQIEDAFNFGEHTWTVISDEFAICNDTLGERCYREDWKAKGANDYEKSDVKKFVDDWLKRWMTYQI